jgi:hypothetical protein
MSLETYFERLENLTKYNKNNKILLDVEKTCGYGEFLFVFKKDTLTEISNTISKLMEFETKRLFVKDENGNELELPLTSDETIREYILRNSQFFKPVYPIPAIVVYKIYYDDGYKHDHEHEHN